MPPPPPHSIFKMNQAFQLEVLDLADTQWTLFRWALMRIFTFSPRQFEHSWHFTVMIWWVLRSVSWIEYDYGNFTVFQVNDWLCFLELSWDSSEILSSHFSSFKNKTVSYFCIILCYAYNCRDNIALWSLVVCLFPSG